MGHGLGFDVETIPCGSFRNTINAGLPFLSGYEKITNDAETRDTLKVNLQKW
jgi:hypothetical protein